MWLEEWYARNASGPGHGGQREPPLIVGATGTPALPIPVGEMCIGVGAHTHYWDRSAPDVANHLDFLISTA